MKILMILLLAATAVAAPALHAQVPGAEASELATLQAAAEKDKKALVASTLKLTDAEAKKFWPAYDSYQRELDLLRRRYNVALTGLVARDKPMTDPYAKSLTNELISVDEQEIKARRRMSKAVMRALPARKAAIYLQLESKLRVIQAYEIAAAFPLGKIP